MPSSTPELGPVLPLSLLGVPLVTVVSVPGTGGNEAEADILHRVVALPCPLPCSKNSSCRESLLHVGPVPAVPAGAPGVIESAPGERGSLRGPV